ncbi:MAG: ABC transporter ATP-binding protein [Chloroflexi bacterium]|jgi:ABC-type lipoprotein export system ATPase subunit|nr:ABC transporter ATP-binding protein [Chloroflexota bacterium]
MNTKTASGAILTVKRLTKVYGTAVPVRALDEVDLSVEAGEIVAVMGPSGSGKSTLLNMLGALDRPTSGCVMIEGNDLDGVRDLDAFRALTLGFVFQMHNLIPTLTAAENVQVPMKGRGARRRRQHERAMEMLELVGLVERAGHLPSQLSGGQRQRVAIARALVNEPRVILADEPTGNLDSVSGREVIELLVRLNRDRGTTILIVTHDRNVARSAQRILQMNDGRIVHEHIVGDALTEDLLALAQSELGRRIIAQDVDALAGLPLVSDGRLTRMGAELSALLRSLTDETRE